MFLRLEGHLLPAGYEIRVVGCYQHWKKKNEYNSFSDVCESFWQIIETEGGLGTPE